MSLTALSFLFDRIKTSIKGLINQFFYKWGNIAKKKTGTIRINFQRHHGVKKFELSVRIFERN